MLKPIKIVITKIINPIKIVIHDFPTQFPIQLKWFVKFKEEIFAKLKMRYSINISNKFITSMISHLKLRGVLNEQPKFKSDVLGRLRLKSTINTSPSFSFSEIGRLKIKTDFNTKQGFNFTMTARTLIFKKWIDINDNLTLEDLGDTTLENFCMTEII